MMVTFIIHSAGNLLSQSYQDKRPPYIFKQLCKTEQSVFTFLNGGALINYRLPACSGIVLATQWQVVVRIQTPALA